MANKDHSLDKPIIEAAREEFLRHGYMKASMRNIAKAAGITTGALYTRYDGKRELFSSLIMNAFRQIDKRMIGVKALYREALESKCSNKFIEAIKLEENVYLDLLYENYDACYLLILRGDGSEIHQKMIKAFEGKIRETINYFMANNNCKVDKDGLELLIKMHLDFYKEIFYKQYSREKAENVLSLLDSFMLPSWQRLFENII